jgi:hypothetical protein
MERETWLLQREKLPRLGFSRIKSFDLLHSEAVQRTGSSAGMTAEEWARMRKEWL